MNKAFVCLLILQSMIVCGQFSVESNFSSVHIGRNQNLTLGYTFNKLSVYAGLKYNFNKLDNFPVSTMLKKTSWATTTGEHFGGVVGVNFRFLDLDDLSLFTFFECQQSFTHVRHVSTIYVGSVVPEPQSDYDLVYQKKLTFIGSWWLFENNLGLGYKVNIFNGLYLTNKFGVGVLLFKNTDKKNLVFFSGGNWELSEMLSFGLGWKFDRKTKKELY